MRKQAQERLKKVPRKHSAGGGKRGVMEVFHMLIWVPLRFVHFAICKLCSNCPYAA